MKTEEFAALLEILAENWTAGNYAAVIEHFAADVFYCDPLRYRFTNRAALREFFENDDGEPQTCVFRRAVFDERQQRGAAEYTYSGTHLYHGTAWIEIDGDRITSWREYQHVADRDWEEFWNRNQ